MVMAEPLSVHARNRHPVLCERTGLEDAAIPNAIGIGVDGDMLAAISGRFAEATFGIPDPLWAEATGYLPANILAMVDRFIRSTYERFHGLPAVCPFHTWLRSVAGLEAKVCRTDVSQEVRIADQVGEVEQRSHSTAGLPTAPPFPF